MQFIVTKTTTQAIAVDANTPEEASTAAKAGQGEAMSHYETINVQPRSQPTAAAAPSAMSRLGTAGLHGGAIPPQAPKLVAPTS